MAENKPDSGASEFDDPLEIPPEDWSEFLDDFSSHEIWNATVEVLGSDGEHDVEIPERPLRGIRFEALRNGNIMVALGPSADGSENEITHTVIRPTKMSVTVGKKVTMMIEAADGSVTVVHCVNISDEPGAGGMAA
jgi:Family of unknown function (DUF5335)